MNQQPFMTLVVCWFTPTKDTKLVVHKEVWLQIMMINPVFLKANKNLIVCLWHPETTGHSQVFWPRCALLLRL